MKREEREERKERRDKREEREAGRSINVIPTMWSWSCRASVWQCTLLRIALRICRRVVVVTTQCLALRIALQGCRRVVVVTTQCLVQPDCFARLPPCLYLLTFGWRCARLSRLLRKFAAEGGAYNVNCVGLGWQGAPSASLGPSQVLPHAL